jgi:hypothetical protein
MPLIPNKFSIENQAGRLIEARVFNLGTLADVNEYARVLGETAAAIPAARRPVLCADHRPVRIYGQAAADRLTELFQNMNERLERVAILVARSNATLVMQLERIVREAQWVNRRVFFETEAAAAHLALSLDAKERERAGAFLAGFTPGPPSSR